MICRPIVTALLVGSVSITRQRRLVVRRPVPRTPRRAYLLGMTTATRRVLAGSYVAVVAALAASAFSDPNAGFTWTREGLAMLLTLPTSVLALPVVYVLGSTIWNTTNADSGGPMWPVTLVYTVMFAGIAIVNLWMLHFMLRRRRMGQSTRGRRNGVAS